MFLKLSIDDIRDMMDSEAWKEDVWLSQLDWTPKVAGKSRGVFPPEVCSISHLHALLALTMIVV